MVTRSPVGTWIYLTTLRFYADNHQPNTASSGYLWWSKTWIVDELDKKSDCDTLAVGKTMRMRSDPLQFVFLDFCDSGGHSYNETTFSAQTASILQNDTWKIAFRLGYWNDTNVDQSYLVWKGLIGQNREPGTDTDAYLKMRKDLWLHLKNEPLGQAYGALGWTYNFAGHDVHTGFPGMGGNQRADVNGHIVGLP